VINQFLFIGLPYLALFLLIGGSIIRFVWNPFSYSALSSQFLEHKALLWGTISFHVGVLIVLLGHLPAFFIPEIWKSLTANFVFLLTVETLGVMASFLCIVGLTILLIRRIVSGKLQQVTTVIDILVLFLILMQVIIGVSMAIAHRWGAVWSTGTTTPYLWSVITLQPDMSYVEDMPMLIQIHLVMAWVILMLVPFSRLVHVFSFPFRYIARPPQKVVWTSERKREHDEPLIPVQESRRAFVKGAVGLSVAGGLLSIGVLDKLAGYFYKPEVSQEEESKLLEQKLKRLKQTTEEKTYQLERMKKQFIYVAHLNQLKRDKGKYFIDYLMRPALAFLGSDGLPNLISAKCTHLGCTVGSTLDNQGRVLCPCHVSYFSIETGMPNEGAPAKDPLPHLGWVLMNGKSEVVLEQDPSGKRYGDVTLSPTDKNYRIYIAKKHKD